MKLKDKQIDFDFIGSQDALTLEDKKLISAFFKKKKLAQTRLPKTKVTKKLKPIDKAS